MAQTQTAIATAEALGRLARGRDADAWSVLLERHGPAVDRVCRRILGDETLAEDACQETWLQVRALAGRFRMRGKDPAAHEAAARGWVLAIAANVALHMQRKRRRDRARDDAHAPVRSDVPSGEDGAMERERAEAVQRELAALNEADRTPIVMHYYGGLGYAELAAALDCPVGTAKARISRGLEKLRQRLALLGLLLALGELDSFLGGSEAHAAEGAAASEAALSQERLARWRELLDSTREPAMPGMAPARGVSTMTKVTAVGAAVLLAAGIALWAKPGNGADRPNAAQPSVARAGGETAPAGPGAKAEAEAVNGLKVTLTADKNSVVAGDTLTLTVKLENVTDKPLTVRVGDPIGATGRSVFERGEALRVVSADGALQAPKPYDILTGIGPGVDFITLAPKSAAAFSCLLHFTRLEVKARFAEWTKEKAGQELLGFTFGRPTRDNPSYPEFFLETGAAGKIRLAVAHEVEGQPGEKLRKNAYRGALDPKAAYWEGKARSNDVEIVVSEAQAGTRALAAAEKPAGPAKPVTEAEKRAVGDAINAFAVDMYGKLADEPGNLFVSPYSVSTALAMTYGGARGNTAAEMAKVLHLGAMGDRAHDVCGALIAELNAEKGPEGKPRGFELAVANRLFGQTGYPFQAPFVALAKDRYAAPLVGLNFKADAEGARKHINAWAEEKTRSRIKDLISEGGLSEDARLVLVNAIYFKGNWAAKFDEKATSAQAFHLDGGKAVQAPLMQQTNKFAYKEIDGRLQVLELPYAGGELSMAVLLPGEKWGLAGLERDLTPANLAAWTSGLTEEQVDVYLPKLKQTWGTTDLAEALQMLGMQDAFLPARANLEGITGAEPPLYISKVLHKTFVKVNEEGTEAAAVTAVGLMDPTSVQEDRPKIFRADRPFLYAIRHKASGAILFLGRVMDPTKE